MTPQHRPTNQQNHDDLAHELRALRLEVGEMRLEMKPVVALYEAAGLGAKIFTWMVGMLAAIAGAWVAIKGVPHA